MLPTTTCEVKKIFAGSLVFIEDEIWFVIAALQD